MTREELKLRQITNQHLLTPVSTLCAVRDLCGVQAQFMSNAMHALKIRCYDFDAQNTAGLVKNWTIRGTVHVFAEADLPLFVRCCDGRDYRRNDWRGYTFWNQRDKWALTPERQAFFADSIVSAVAEKSRSREELKQICRDIGMNEAEESSMFDSWGGGIRELCERGFIHYAVQEEKVFALTPAYTPMEEEAARLEIARRYFTHFAPAAIHDAMYFLGAKQREVKSWLENLPVRSTECEGKTYYYIENGMAYTQDIPLCVFLAGFEPLMLGYQKKESLYLPDIHLRKIFNLAGIVMPAVLLRGNVVGRWKKKQTRLTVELFETLSTSDRNLIADSAAALWEDLRKVEFA